MSELSVLIESSKVIASALAASLGTSRLMLFYQKRDKIKLDDLDTRVTQLSEKSVTEDKVRSILSQSISESKVRAIVKEEIEIHLRPTNVALENIERDLSAIMSALQKLSDEIVGTQVELTKVSRHS